MAYTHKVKKTITMDLYDTTSRLNVDTSAEPFELDHLNQ